MGNLMEVPSGSFMVFIFKALFLKTLKFQLCRYFSLRWFDQFSWDKKKIIHNLGSYGSKSCNFKIFMYKYFSHDKNPINSKKNGKVIAKTSVFGMKKYLHIKTLILQMPSIKPQTMTFPTLI